MNPSCVFPTSASISGNIRKPLACQQIPEGTAEGTYSCVHPGSTSAQCEACIKGYNESWRIVGTTKPQDQSINVIETNRLQSRSFMALFNQLRLLIRIRRGLGWTVIAIFMCHAIIPIIMLAYCCGCDENGKYCA